MTRALGVDPQGFKASSIFKLDREQSHLQGIEPSKQTWWNFSLSVELLKPLFKCLIGFKSLKPVLNCLEGNIVDRIQIPQVDFPFFPYHGQPPIWAARRHSRPASSEQWPAHLQSPTTKKIVLRKVGYNRGERTKADVALSFQTRFWRGESGEHV